MNSKEIKEALKIINEPITVNCIEYKYFDEENYNKITNVYENCLWFANNLEQINLTVENLQKENQKLKDEIYKSNAVADTNIELAESYYKEIERLKGLLKCDYEDGQTIIAELTTENKQLKENNLAMQEEMDRTWDKLQQKEDIINKISKKCNKEKGRTDFDIFIKLNEQLKTLEGFAKKIDYNLHPIITEAYKCDIRNSIDDLCKTLRYDVVYKDSIKEILDNKGDEK